MDRVQLKLLAREQIKGKIGILFVISIIIAAISIIASMIPMLGGVINAFFLTPSFALSLALIYLKVADRADIKVGDIFEGFYDFWGAFKVTFLTGLFIFLWSLLFLLPGIVKGFSYSLAILIYAENREMGALEAITKSREMMDGHKMELFVLFLSFIGWGILGCITFGLAFIYVEPYMNTAFINFYNSLKEKNYATATVLE